MMRRRGVYGAAAILSGLLLFPGSGAASVLLVGGQEGTEDPPAPTEGAETEEDWNPKVTCTLPPGGSIFELLDCLLDRIATPPPPCPIGLGGMTPPGGSGFPVELEVGDEEGECSDPHARQDFIVTLVPLPQYGVEIRRLDGSEIDRIRLRENDPGIQTTELRNDRPDRVARFRQIEETPAGSGILLLSIDETTVLVKTSAFPTPQAINAEILRQLTAAGFRLSYASPYVYVWDHRQLPGGVNRIRFRSRNAGIFQSDIGLYPESQSDLPPPGSVYLVQE